MHPPLYVEVSSLGTRQLTGIGRLTARLVEALARLTPLRLFSTLPGPFRFDIRRSRPLRRGELIAIATGDVAAIDGDLDAWVGALLRRPRCPVDAVAARASACVYTLFRPTERHFAREVSVLYDFTPLVLPATHLPQTVRDFGALFAALRHSDKAVAISQATRADARWLCALPSEDVVVSYPGPSLCARTHASPAAVRRARQLILVVSTLEPRKNPAFVRDWFLATDALDPGTELWWVGPHGWLWERTPAPRRRDRAIRFRGMLSDRELCELYRRATFTLYASLYEGFGFPVLDALLHGTPVVCSYNSSLKEFAGPGVFYFDPGDAASLDQACRDVLAAPPGVERPDLRLRCSWESLAHTVASLCDIRVQPARSS